MNFENRRKTGQWSEDIRKKVIAKHGQGKGYKTISKELNVPVTTVANVIKKFKAHGTVANISGRGHKRKIEIEQKNCSNSRERTKENVNTDPS